MCGQCTKRKAKPGRKWCEFCLARIRRAAVRGEVVIVAPDDVKPAKPEPPKTVSDVFAPFASQLSAIDWRDPVRREAEIGALLGQMFAAVALAPALTDADREKLQWLMSLSRQMVAFRDASALEAARRKLSGEDEPKPEEVDGPQLEPSIVVASGSDNVEANSGREKQTFRGRPRARAFS